MGKMGKARSRRREGLKMEKGDYKIFMKLNGAFDKAMLDLREHHVKEIQDLRNLYFGATRRIKKLEQEIEVLKGEK